jgi:hypothetical protein
MFRRTFFKSIGAAILGTAIALKIPDSLVPINYIPEPEVYLPSFSQINTLYNRACFGGLEPDFMYVPKYVYEALIEGRIIQRQHVFATDDKNGKMGIKFRNAVIHANSWNDDTISVFGPLYGNGGRLNLLTGKMI